MGRWCGKSNDKKIEDKRDAMTDGKDKGVEDVFIERDRIIACSFVVDALNESDNENEKKKLDMKHRVLSVHTKRSNKWFMTSIKQTRNHFMKEEELKKFRCAIRLIVEGAFEGYDDVALTSDKCPRKHFRKIITGLDIVNVHNEMHNY